MYRPTITLTATKDGKYWVGTFVIGERVYEVTGKTFDEASEKADWVLRGLWMSFLSSERCSEILRTHQHSCLVHGSWECQGAGCPLPAVAKCDACDAAGTGRPEPDPDEHEPEDGYVPRRAHEVEHSVSEVAALSRGLL